MNTTTSTATADAIMSERRLCPGCDGRALKLAHTTSYSDPPLVSFLSEYYPEYHRWSERLAHYTFKVMKCTECSLYFQATIPTPAFLEVIYDRWIGSVGADEAELSTQQALSFPPASRAGQEILCVARFLDRGATGMRVLDYGMGLGMWARVASRMRCETFGFDLSSKRVEIAKRHGVATVSDESLPGLELDFINTEQVFEHLADPLGCAKKLASGLRTGGILKISVPQAADLERRLDVLDWRAKKGTSNSLNPIHPLEHLNCFTHKSLIIMAQQAGLHPVTIPVVAHWNFLRHSLSRNWLSGAAAKQLTKGIVRPLYNALSRNNIYMWFQKRSALS